MTDAGAGQVPATWGHDQRGLVRGPAERDGTLCVETRGSIPPRRCTFLLCEGCASMPSLLKAKGQTGTPLPSLSFQALLARSLTVAAVQYRGHAPALARPAGGSFGDLGLGQVERAGYRP